MKTPKLKPTKKLIEELEQEIKVTQKCMEEYAGRENFEDALECKNTLMTLNFVIDLAKGKLD
jgi:excinuclease UvrABC helicase subunit UvrB